MRDNYQLYSEEMKDWVKDNIINPMYSSYAELAIAFNMHFGTQITGSKLSDLCLKRLKIKRNFNSTTFKSGHRMNLLPIGTIKKTKDCTYIKVKDNDNLYKGYAEPFWIPIQKYIYEQAYGKIPEGSMVIFLDCNRNNLSLDNLAVIDRQTSAFLATKGMYSKNGTLTKTGILCYQLYKTAKEVE